jgi:hypothetical protein
MLYLHCTKKLLDRLKPEVIAGGTSTTGLGNWYATALLWKPQLRSSSMNGRCYRS